MNDIELILVVWSLLLSVSGFVSGYMFGRRQGWIAGFTHSEKSRDWWHISKQRERIR